jgi:hypothetical protein
VYYKTVNSGRIVADRIEVNIVGTHFAVTGEKGQLCKKCLAADPGGFQSKTVPTYRLKNPAVMK